MGKGKSGKKAKRKTLSNRAAASASGNDPTTKLSATSSGQNVMVSTATVANFKRKDLAKPNISSTYRRISTSVIYEKRLRDLQERSKQSWRPTQHRGSGPAQTADLVIVPPTFEFTSKIDKNKSLNSSMALVDGLLIGEESRAVDLVPPFRENSTCRGADQQYVSTDNSTLAKDIIDLPKSCRQQRDPVTTSNSFSCLEVDDEEDVLIDTGDHRGAVPKRLLIDIKPSFLPTRS